MTHPARLALIPLVALGALTLTAGSAGASKATTVKAVETEFHIALSKKTFKPGAYTFVAENKGKVTHALEITGPGLHDPATPDISPGNSANLKVVLKDGKYDVFCPVPGHKMLGMNLDIVVSGKGHGSGSASMGSAASSGSGASY